MKGAIWTLLLALGLQAQEPVDRLGDLLAIPYLEDGVQDESGRWTFLSHPERTQPGRGLNCSGFLIVGCRRLLGSTFPLEVCRKDRLGDSGPGASRGRDWDYGWDLVFNLSEGSSPRVLGPGGYQAPRGSGATLRGFPLEDPESWGAVLPRMRQDRIYLASISRAPRGRVSHYHVGLLLKDRAGAVWFYHTLPQGCSHRINLASEQGFQRFQAIFGRGKRILLVEV